MKLGIIGSYGHLNIVLDSLPGLQDVQVVAAARYAPEDPVRFVGRHSHVGADVPVYDDYRQLLDRHRPDLVSVCMPLFRNAEVSIAAARAGCHVFSEKPLATTLEDLSALRRAVELSGVKIAAMFQMRASPPFQAVRSAVEQGRIGRSILASAQKSYPFGLRDQWYRTRRTYGGTIPWQAIHALEYISYTTGQDYTRVCAMHSNLTQPEYPGFEDNGGILLGLSGGGHAVITFDYLRPKAPGTQRRHGDDRLRIAGSEAIVEVVDEGARAILLTPTTQEELPLPPPRDLFAEFVASIREGTPCLVSPQESFRITEVALQARQSADTGRLIEL